MNAGDVRRWKVEKDWSQTIMISGRRLVGFTVFWPSNETRRCFITLSYQERDQNLLAQHHTFQPDISSVSFVSAYLRVGPGGHKYIRGLERGQLA